MGTLGTYLSSAREAKGLDLHDAAQQTRISVHFLKAMEREDFSKLPGEVFVKGFLKSYARFLDIDEKEVMKRYRELRPQPQPQPAAAQEAQAEEQAAAGGEGRRQKIPVEPVLWGAAIVITLAVFLFISLPKGHETDGQPGVTQPAGQTPLEVKQETPSLQPPKQEKLYLEIMAIDDVWLLVRTDASPQKKAILKKGENVVWSADQRFLLSYGAVGAVRLLLNGKELEVKGPKSAVVRDLIITASGIVSSRIKAEPRKVKPKPITPTQPPAVASPTPQPQPPASETAQPQPQLQPTPQTQEAPAAPEPQSEPAPTPTPLMPATAPPQQN